MILRNENGKDKLFPENLELETVKVILEVLSEHGNSYQQGVANNLLHRVRRGDGWTFDQARIFDGWSRDLGYECVNIPDVRSNLQKMEAELAKRFAQTRATRSNLVDFDTSCKN